ncbi:LPXTG-site transpeptidase (sortase) family protein [Klenkia marina]|uniref:LPXTG-site transpeptidase (Sortase) family protein n=1 Tax=Klenkia marina TaxID=1960309 RepID=A0A1G4YPW1_9ACTN|nr:LPXTG-site transpeptidase (sortase) family protein [Klenkia marina]
MTSRGLRPLVLAVGAVLALSACAGATEPAAAPPPSSPAPSSPAPSSPGPSPPAAPSAATPPTSSLDPAAVPEPTAVRIPALGVDQDLIGLGVATDGTAEVPEDFSDVAWFAPGGRPGSRGPTVLMGHVDSTAGPAVFYELRDLTPGDTVELTTADGSVATYTVTGTEQVAKDTFPTAAVFGATTEDVLRLITCTGAFDAGARSYTDNLVVTAARTG